MAIQKIVTDDALSAFASDVKAAIANVSSPLVYKGTLGTGGTISTLPVASASNNGFAYVVITAGTYQGVVCAVGDVIASNGTAWNIIPQANSAETLPITNGSAVNTKEYIDDKTTLVKSASGDLITISDGGDNIPLKSCEVTINPDLSGKTECNLVVCNKNLYEPTTVSQIAGGITCTNNNDGTYTCSNQATQLQQFSLGTIKLPAGTYVLSGCPIGGSLTTFDLRWTNSYIDTGSGVIITSDGNTTSHVVITIRNGYNCGSGITFKPMICKVDTPNPDYAHFEKKSATTYNIQFGTTVTTGGTLDVINGVLTVGGVETQLTPVTPKTLSGINNIFSDCGDVEVEYFTSSADGLAALIEVLSNS